MISLTLPWPPSGNHRNGTRGTRRYPTAAYKQFIRDVALGLLRQMGPGQPLRSRLIVHCAYTPPDRHVRDKGNVEKSLFDAITKAGRLWVDDCQVRGGSPIWHPPRKPGRVDLVVFEDEWRSWEDNIEKKVSRD